MELVSDGVDCHVSVWLLNAHLQSRSGGRAVLLLHALVTSQSAVMSIDCLCREQACQAQKAMVSRVIGSS